MPRMKHETESSGRGQPTWALPYSRAQALDPSLCLFHSPSFPELLSGRPFPTSTQIGLSPSGEQSPLFLWWLQLQFSDCLHGRTPQFLPATPSRRVPLGGPPYCSYLSWVLSPGLAGSAKNFSQNSSPPLNHSPHCRRGHPNSDSSAHPRGCSFCLLGWFLMLGATELPGWVSLLHTTLSPKGVYLLLRL